MTLTNQLTDLKDEGAQTVINAIDVIDDDVYTLPATDNVNLLKLDLSNSILTQTEEERLVNLIDQHKSVFSQHGLDLGYTKLIEHSIQLVQLEHNPG
mgnify:CR=1 FL=1